MFIKNLLSSFLILILSVTIVRSQEDNIQQRIFLVGDAGALDNSGKNPVIDWLKRNVDWNDSVNKVIFLGDNIYEMGMPMEGAPDYKRAKGIIDYQIGLVKGKKAKAYIVPGNHDWMNGKIGGLQQAINETD